MYTNGSRDGDEASSKSTPPASSMLWVRNLRRFIGSGAGLGSEALMGIYTHIHMYYTSLTLSLQ